MYNVLFSPFKRNAFCVISSYLKSCTVLNNLNYTRFESVILRIKKNIFYHWFYFGEFYLILIVFISNQNIINGFLDIISKN